MKTHISINVEDPKRSAEFYSKVFQTEPQKQTDWYVKFDLEEPALNFALMSGSEPSRVSHFGIEVESAEDVARWKRHLESADLLKYEEKKTDCCYARQDKAWFEDPDGNKWEIFYVYEQLPLKESSNKAKCCA